MNISAGLKAAAKSLIKGPRAESFRAAGKQVVCPHCENILFHRKKISMHTAFSSLVNLEWTDGEANVLVCANCSRIEWFHDNVETEKS